MTKGQYIPEKNLKIMFDSIAIVDTGYKTPCWIWTKALNKSGYAQFWFKDFGKGKSKNHRGHRATYQHFIGEIPEGLDLDHQCDVEACMCPWHCKPMTNAENNKRKWEVIFSLKLKVKGVM
jgi:hypothetical protein